MDTARLGQVFDAVFLNGTVGAGKSVTAMALSERLQARRTPHAVIDLDQIRLLFPAPTGDPFQHEVELATCGRWPPTTAPPAPPG